MFKWITKFTSGLFVVFILGAFSVGVTVLASSLFKQANQTATRPSPSPVASPGVTQEVTEQPITYNSFCTGKTGTTYASLLVTQKANDGKTYNMPQKDWDCYWKGEENIANNLVYCKIDQVYITQAECDRKSAQYLALLKKYFSALTEAMDSQQAIWTAQDAYLLSQFKARGEANLADFENSMNQEATEVQASINALEQIQLTNLTITEEPKCVPKPIIQGGASGFSCL